MTLPEAAELLGLTPAALRQAIRRGTLAASKRGRDWWVTEGEVRAYEREHKGRVGRPRKERAT